MQSDTSWDIGKLCQYIEEKRALSPLEGPSLMICQIGPPFASLYPAAGMVPKPGLVQLLPTLLDAVSHRGLDCTVVGTTFQTWCLMAEWQWAAQLR